MCFSKNQISKRFIQHKPNTTSVFTLATNLSVGTSFSLATNASLPNASLLLADRGFLEFSSRRQICINVSVLLIGLYLSSEMLS